MPRVSSEISPRIAELLQAGVITITTSWFASGSETYGRVTQPHSRLGIYPHYSYKLEELETSLEKISVPSMHAAPVSSGPVTPRTTPTKKGNAVTVINRNDPDIGKVPAEIGINGVRNILPKGSLCWKDLSHLSDDQLNRRVLAIGKELGVDKAVSRIESISALAETPAPTLYKWWVSASVEQRLILISNSKQLGKVNEEDKMALLARLGAGQYPFRGSDQNLEEGQGEEESEEEGESGLRIEFDSLSI